MHGRVKVKTTEEQQEAKRKEREKKLKLYTAALDRCFTKRQNGEYDEEALKISGDILSMNSDVYTLWNFRKEIFLQMKETREEDEIQKLGEDELHFLESCLKRNPKSYGVWQHRCFIMESIPRPDWKQELQLCNLFLEYDERNFHCWDYRRFVVKQSNIPAEDELAFTSSKICNNFSNFSSWHYRSKLLPLLYPDESAATGVSEDVLIKEYETVQNAFFTDPDDQSAWFYHRWLLGRGKKKSGVACMYLSRPRQLLMITTTQPIKINSADCDIDISVNGERQKGRWSNHSNKEHAYSHIWKFQACLNDHGEGHMNFLPPGDLEVAVAADAEDWGSSDVIRLSAGQSENWVVTQDEQGTRFRHELSAATTDTLQRELDSVLELYTLEPHNKWVMLTILSLMKALDPIKYAVEVDSHISSLQTIDPCRKAYYEDLRSRYVIENYLETVDFNARSVCLAKQGLTCLYHMDLLSIVTKADFSHNKLKCCKSLSSLQCVRELILDGNELADLQELSSLSTLEVLSLKNNLLSSVESLRPLSSCCKLTILNLSGNPLADKLNHAELHAVLPSVKVLDTHAVNH